MDCGIVARVDAIQCLGLMLESAFWRLIFWLTTFVKEFVYLGSLDNSSEIGV